MNTRWVAVLLLAAVATGGCKLKDDSGKAPSDVASPPSDALKTASGLAYKVVTVGLGSIHPDRTSTVKVFYTGWTTDGKMFESNVGGKPAEFQVRGVIPGWTEMLQMMVVGEKVRVWIPPDLAYGDHPQGGQPGGMLVFEMELVDLR